MAKPKEWVKVKCELCWRMLEIQPARYKVKLKNKTGKIFCSTKCAVQWRWRRDFGRLVEEAREKGMQPVEENVREVWIIKTVGDGGTQMAFSSFRGKFALVPVVDGKVRNASSFGSQEEAKAWLEDFALAWPPVMQLPNLSYQKVQISERKK